MLSFSISLMGRRPQLFCPSANTNKKRASAYSEIIHDDSDGASARPSLPFLTVVDLKRMGREKGKYTRGGLGQPSCVSVGLTTTTTRLESIPTIKSRMQMRRVYPGEVMGGSSSRHIHAAAY